MALCSSSLYKKKKRGSGEKYPSSTTYIAKIDEMGGKTSVPSAVRKFLCSSIADRHYTTSSLGNFLYFYFLQVGVAERSERAGAPYAGRAVGGGPGAAGSEPAGDRGRR